MRRTLHVLLKIVWLTVCGWAPAVVPGPPDTSTPASGPRSPDSLLPRGHQEPRPRPRPPPPGSYRQRRSCCKTPALAPGGPGRARRGGVPWWWWRPDPGGLGAPDHRDSLGPRPATGPVAPNHLWGENSRCLNIVADITKELNSSTHSIFYSHRKGSSRPNRVRKVVRRTQALPLSSSSFSGCLSPDQNSGTTEEDRRICNISSSQPPSSRPRPWSHRTPNESERFCSVTEEPGDVWNMEQEEWSRQTHMQFHKLMSGLCFGSCA